MATCKYAGATGAGLEQEVTDGDMVACTADADVIVRLASQMPARKTPVCREHARWLRSDDVELDWEQCGEIR